MENEARLKLHKKLASVRDDVDYIQKKGKNKFHGYNYATEADVLANIRESLKKHNLSITPETIDMPVKTERPTKTGTTIVTTIVLKFIIVDLETGYSEERRWIGEGEDATDKGVYKAFAGGVKYFLLKTFMIETGDDPDNDSKSISSKQSAIESEQVIMSQEEINDKYNEYLDKMELCESAKQLVTIGNEIKGVPFKEEQAKVLRDNYTKKLQSFIDEVARDV